MAMDPELPQSLSSAQPDDEGYHGGIKEVSKNQGVHRDTLLEQPCRKSDDLVRQWLLFLG
jgi:hypothetical protein